MIKIHLHPSVISYLRCGNVYQENNATYYLNLHEVIMQKGSNFYVLEETDVMPDAVRKIYSEQLQKYTKQEV